MSFEDFLPLFRLSFRDPAAAYRHLRALNLRPEASWIALAVSVLLSTLLAALSAAAQPEMMMPVLREMIAQPISFAMLQMAGLAIGTWLLTAFGRAAGGRGSFADLLLAMAWIELLFLASQAVQTVLQLVSPLLAGLFGLVATVIVVWISVQMIRTAHGFANAILVFFGIIATLIATVFLLSIVAAALGIVPEIPAEVLS